jgi:hypothetical protein
VADPDEQLAGADLTTDTLMVLRKGKSTFALLRFPA